MSENAVARAQHRPPVGLPSVREAEDDPAAPLELKRVTNVFQHVAYDLQNVSLRDADGDDTVIVSTDEHPYFVVDQGWTNALGLAPGDRVLSSNGSVMTVVANTDDKRPEGIVVHNFAVEVNHTYFVNDDVGDGWAWVHNSCVTHIFHGEINKAGKAVGFHHVGSIGSEASGRITGILSGPNPNGVFEATVEILNRNTGQWIPKVGKSTFFPSAWSRAKVLREIKSALADARATGNVNGLRFRGVSPSGMTIDGYLDRLTGAIAAAWPKI